MQFWEYCEVAWTPKQIIVRVYTQRDKGSYEGVMKPKEWGILLAQLGADGWELTGVVPTKPANHTLYYSKRPIDQPSQVEWKEKGKASQ